MNTTLRWISVLPAAVGAYLFMALVMFFTSLLFSSTYGLWMLNVLSSMACPWVFIVAGWLVAPKFKTRTAIVLVTIHAVVVSVGTTLGFISPSPSLPKWWIVASTLIGIASTIVVTIRLSSMTRQNISSANPSILATN